MFQGEGNDQERRNKIEELKIHIEKIKRLIFRYIN